MSDIPIRLPAQAPPLPPSWTEHKAPSGHTYYYNQDTKQSTYSRPLSGALLPSSHFQRTVPQSASSSRASAQYNSPPVQDASYFRQQMQDLIFSSAPEQHAKQPGPGRKHREDQQNRFSQRQRRQEDRPKHRQDIPDCVPWVLVRTKLGRRFVWNRNTNESFWKFPPHVLKAVVKFDRRESDRRESKETVELDQKDSEVVAMATIEAELARTEEEMEVVEVDGEEEMEHDEEYEEVEVTDDEGEDTGPATKRQRIAESGEEKQHMKQDEDDDLAWQLAQMEAMEDMQQQERRDEESSQGPELTEEDCQTLFKELLDDARISPYLPWDKILEDEILYDDERYKALPTMAARKECFKNWSRERAQALREEKAMQRKTDPKIPYLAFLDRHATPKLYWPEFRRKFRKEAELKDAKLSEKEREKIYREHIKRLGMRSSDLKLDLSALLKAQPLALLNRSTTIDSLPTTVLTDLRYISLPWSNRKSLIETYISTLPPVSSDSVTFSVEEEAERMKQMTDRARRNKALADRERRVQEEKKKQERDLVYGKGRLKEEQEEIERAMNITKQGLKEYLK